MQVAWPHAHRRDSVGREFRLEVVMRLLAARDATLGLRRALARRPLSLVEFIPP